MCKVCESKERKSMIKPKLRQGSISLYDYCMENEDKKYLLDEWDYEKNSELGLGPHNVGKSSRVKVWWTCENGHSYLYYVSHKADSAIKCHVCNHTVVLKGVNDLSTLYPDLAKEWDESNNITPYEITDKSSHTVVWKCDKGHIYEARINDRTRGVGCPYCSNHRVLKGFNDFEFLHPELLQYWDYEKNEIKPNEVVEKSGLKVWWKCERGHSYQQSVGNKVHGAGCPVCANQVVQEGYNDFASVHPELLKYWNYNRNTIRPSEIAKSSKQKVWWVCDKGHEWQAVVGHVAKGSKCPICSNRRVLKGFNDLATTHPYLIKEWDFEKNDVKPSEFTYGSQHKVWWKCSKGHSWKTSISNRSRGDKTGCPYCSNRTTRPEASLFIMLSDSFENAFHLKKIDNTEFDICVEDLKLLIEYDGWIWHKDKREEDSRKDEIAKNNGYTFIRIWEYDSKDKWTDVINLSNNTLYYDTRKGYDYNVLCQMVKGYLNRIFKKDLGLSIPKDLEQKIEEYVSHEKDEISIDYLYPEIAKEWHPTLNGQLTPKDFTKGSKYKAYWVCKCGHTYKKSIYNRTSGQGCPYCSNKKVLAGFNDMATTHPQLANEFNYEKNDFLPTEIVAGTAKYIWWKCEKGHEWKTKGNNRVQGYGCPYCSGKRKLEKSEEQST